MFKVPSFNKREFRIPLQGKSPPRCFVFVNSHRLEAHDFQKFTKFFFLQYSFRRNKNVNCFLFEIFCLNEFFSIVKFLKKKKNSCVSNSNYDLVLKQCSSTRKCKSAYYLIRERYLPVSSPLKFNSIIYIFFFENLEKKKQEKGE